jgi:hypothetical protein
MPWRVLLLRVLLLKRSASFVVVEEEEVSFVVVEEEVIFDVDALPPDVREQFLRRSSTKYEELYKASVTSVRVMVGEEFVDADTLPPDVREQLLRSGYYNGYEVSVRLSWLSFLIKIIKLNLIPHFKTINLWFIGLSEEYQAHFVDLRNAMIEAGTPCHIIRRKLIWYWFIAVVWTPIFSQLLKVWTPIFSQLLKLIQSFRGSN